MKSKIGFILALIGGIGQLLIGFLTIMMLLFVSFITAPFLTFMIPGFFGKIFSGYFGAIVFLVAGGVSIWASTKMRKEDNAQVRKGGIIALISGIVGGLNILVIIGAIVALVQSNK